MYEQNEQNVWWYWWKKFNSSNTIRNLHIAITSILTFKYYKNYLYSVKNIHMKQINIWIKYSGFVDFLKYIYDYK